MTLAIAWLVFPLALSALTLGSGLLAERLSGVPIPGCLLMPLGLVVMIVVTQITTHQDSTAELSTPLVIAVAAAGLASGRRRLRQMSLDRWAGVAAAGSFVAYAAPVVLAGQATFAGYTLLGDTAIHFVLIDRVMEHGRDLAGLEPSSYRSALEAYFNSAYPLGAHTALGAVRPLTGQDVAWVFQPYLAFLVALGSLVLYSLAEPLIRSRGLRAAVAFTATQAALMYAFALQGSVKELAAVLIVVLLVALVPVFLSAPGRVRAVLPLALTSAAGLGVLSLAITPWLGLTLIGCLGLLLARRRTSDLRLTIAQVGIFVIPMVVLAFPSLLEGADFVRGNRGVVTGSGELGNLFGPLDRLQVMGIWPVGDYRLRPTGLSLTITYGLIGLAAGAALLGLVWALRRRAVGPPLLSAVSLLGGSYVLWRGSPWVDAKAIMIASPAVMFMAMLGAGALHSSGRRTGAILLALTLTLGVLWSNALAYRSVRLAPRERLAELEDVGGLVAGKGPTLYTEFEEYAKHFLRDGAPTGASEAYQPPDPTGERVRRFGISKDLDEFSLGYVLRYRSIVLRRSPSTSRPPSPYRRVFAGRYYEVWRRSPAEAFGVAAHIGFGDRLQPAAIFPCSKLRGLAAEARRLRGRLAYVARPRVLAGVPDTAATPQSRGLHLVRSGRFSAAGTLSVETPGRYEVWLQGSYGRGVDVVIDGRRLGTVSYKLNGNGQYTLVGELHLALGQHAITISPMGVSLHPGNGSGDRRLGLLAIAPAGEFRQVRFLDPARFRTLCGEQLDWVEVVPA